MPKVSYPHTLNCPVNAIPPINRSGCVLRLHIEGVDEHGGDVRLGAFIEKLAALKSALSETANIGNEGLGGKVDFFVTNLSHSSPAMVEVTAVSSDVQVSPAKVVNDFLNFIRGTRDRTVQADSSNAKLVDPLRKLLAGVDERFDRIWLDAPDIEPIMLDASVAKALDDALPDVRREFGTVKGVVKRYSGVGKRPYFKIIPPIGGTEIKCVFPQELLEKAAASVEHSATVEGELKSYEGDLWPHEVAVRDIQIHASDDDLPTLAGLAGEAPEATGELSAAEFVRRLRNEW